MDSLEAWSIILSVLSIGLACLIWHNQTKASIETEKIIRKIDAYNDEVRRRLESSRSHSLSALWFYFLFTWSAIGKLMMEVEEKEKDERLQYFRKSEENLRLALETMIRSYDREKIFLVTFITGEQRKKIEDAILSIRVLKDYGELVAIDEPGLLDWINKADKTIKDILEAGEAMREDAFPDVKIDVDKIIRETTNDS